MPIVQKSIHWTNLAHLIKNKNKRAVIMRNENSLLVQHCAEKGHEFDSNDVQIVDRCSQWLQVLFLEV